MTANPDTIFETEIARNDLILRSIDEGVCVIDPDNNVSFANESALRMLGWLQHELIGKSYATSLLRQDFDEQTDEQMMVNPIHFVRAENQRVHVNTETLYRRDGSKFLVEYDCIPLPTQDLVIVFRDITEQRDLEIAVSEARDAALVSAEEKANFLANMSHEIRTPLNGIIGISAFLAETKLSTEQNDYVATISASAQLLLDIVNDILDFSKIEAGKMELEEVDFDLRELIGETIKLFIPQAFQKKNQLKFEIDDAVETSRTGDAGRLRQILHNLLSNSIKFTEKGEVALNVLNEADGFLRFEVSDTGIGIAPEKHLQIFEPFSQADASTTRQYGGTGLGLAISKQLVQMMSGKIGVESEKDRGSTFWFTAKIAEQHLSTKFLPAETEKTSLDKSDIRVLIVDDNPINQRVALGSLGQIGVSADLACDGFEAVGAAKNKEYNLILMDCQMPKMDGYQATREIRQLDEHVKIIAMTASVAADEREKCLAAGMNDYLPKPISIDGLTKTLDKHFLFNTTPSSIDSEFSGHPLATIIEEKTLKSFIEIEARGEKNFAREMLNLYLKHSETQLSELKSAVANKNVEIVKNKAHALRGSSANIGLTNLLPEFNELEQTVETDWLSAEQILIGVLEKFAELQEKVSQIEK